MGSLNQRLARIRKYKNFTRIINETVKDFTPEILAMNRDRMYEEGIMDVNNPSVTYQYNPNTARQKKKRARYKRTDHITLRWTGSLYDKMKVIIKKTEFLITSTDEKWGHFKTGDWGQGRFENALGLVEEDKNELRKLFKQDWIIRFRHDFSA